MALLNCACLIQKRFITVVFTLLCRNYNSELVAFQARLGEKFDDSKLREAFITADFVEAETKRQEELQIKGENQLSQLLSSNQNLATEGSRVVNQTLSAYVRWVRTSVAPEPRLGSVLARALDQKARLGSYDFSKSSVY